MKTTRHIHINDSKDGCIRQEFSFDPPIELQSTLGAIDEIYAGVDLEGHVIAEEIIPVINRNGILHISEVMKAGAVFSIEVRKGYRLNKIVIDSANTLQLLATPHKILYWFTIGRDGIFEITGELVKDDDGILGKLKADLKDPHMRGYLVKRSLADSEVSMAKLDEPPKIMKHNEAAKYLRLASQTLYNKVAAGEIPRRPGNVYLKEDLDAYIRKPKSRGR